MIKIDLKLLDKQIKDLLESNINENSKTALHSLLGELYDNLKDTGTAIIEIWNINNK